MTVAPPTQLRPYVGEYAQFGGLKKVLRKITGPVLAAGAVAAGQPQLAVAAYGVGKSVTKKKAKAPDFVAPPVEDVPPPLFGSLTTADRNALLIGGVGLLAILLLKGKR